MGSRRRSVAVDTETHLIKPGEAYPKCVSVALHNERNSALVLADKGAEMVGECLESRYTLIFANPGFDIGVLSECAPELFPLFVQALREGRIWCVQVAQKLLDIAAGCRRINRYSLGALTERFLEVELDKGEDSWRLRYAELDGVPVKRWPAAARDYAEADARYTWEHYKRQRRAFERFTEMQTQFEDRIRFDVALHFMSREGMRVKAKPVRALRRKLDAGIKKARPALVEQGLLKDKNKDTGKVDLFTGEVSEPEWSKDVNSIRERVLDKADKIYLTDKGAVKIDASALEGIRDPLLQQYSEYSKLCSVWNKDLTFLERGVTEGAVHTRYDSVLDTGRVSSSNPNLMNLARAPGVRECFVPREGYVYLDVDWSGAELCTLAQTCLALFGQSALADALNQGLDPHIMMAQRFAGVDDYEGMCNHPELKHYRQIAKPANFGPPGGMGPNGLHAYAKAMGVDLDEVGIPAKQLLRAWHEQWPEMRGFFAWVQRQLPLVRLPIGSHRLRHTEHFTEAANYCFQGPAADGAALAGWALFEACYHTKSSPLFGCKPVLFVHDQYVVEAPKDQAKEALVCMEEIMVREFNRITPDVPVSTEGEIKTHWSK